jgi:hypothetical protein
VLDLFLKRHCFSQNHLPSATPPIFALAESVFMAAETVTPNAPATSGKSSDKIHRIMQN